MFSGFAPSRKMLAVVCFKIKVEPTDFASCFLNDLERFRAFTRCIFVTDQFEFFYVIREWKGRFTDGIQAAGAAWTAWRAVLLPKPHKRIIFARVNNFDDIAVFRSHHYGVVLKNASACLSWPRHLITRLQLSCWAYARIRPVRVYWHSKRQK